MTTDRTGCPRCGAGVPPGARFCSACGYATARIVPGETLDGKYEILDKIGEGGMGEVYRARHLHLDEIRIIKVTKPDALGEGGQPRRFQQEARLATLVRHPNVAALYDFSRLPDGSHYMVWEFIDGITLEEWLRRRGPLPLPRALDVARQVLSGLAQIHAQGIVHRDLSPDNVMLRETADGLQAKIIDLGIAKRIEAETLQMTGTGMFVGKLKYCSPEQAGALPSGESVDARSDLYSFGVVLYEMLTGKPPFEATNPEGYLGKHLHTPAPPLDVSRLPTSVGPELAAIVKRALEKNRDRRFRSAREFQAALERLLPYATEPAEQEAPTVAIGRGVRRIRVTVAAALSVLVAAAGYLAWRASRPGRAVAAPVATSPSPPAVVVDTPALPTPNTDAAAAGPGIGAVRESPTPATGLPTAVAAEAPSTEVASRPPEPSPPPAGSPKPEEVRRAIERWRNRPADSRAHAAPEVAAMANRFVAAYPDDPLASELRERLPATFKRSAEMAWDNARPLFAALYYRAYRQLHFAPPDPELERRAAESRNPPRRRRAP
jgi:tRNA A-37 threonylcarbamoyl transferase component Bud32